MADDVVRVVLIIVAMEEEAAPLVEKLSLRRRDTPFLAGSPMWMVAWSGEFGGLTVHVVWCGQDRRYKVNNVATTAAAVSTYAAVAALARGTASRHETPPSMPKPVPRAPSDGKLSVKRCCPRSSASAIADGRTLAEFDTVRSSVTVGPSASHAPSSASQPGACPRRQVSGLNSLAGEAFFAAGCGGNAGGVNGLTGRSGAPGGRCDGGLLRVDLDELSSRYIDAEKNLAVR